jgi:hypothetical protein
MPNTVITQVKRLGHTNAAPNMFDFSDRNGVLFEWNEDVDETPKGIIEEDVVFYPSLAAETPGVVIKRDQPIPSMEDEIEPQGHAEDSEARNANLEPINAAGVDTPTIIHANVNEIADADDDDDGILSIATIPQGQNNLHPLILHDSSDEEQAEGDDDYKNEEDNDDNEDDDDEAMLDHAADNADKGVAEAEDQTEEQQESGVRRSRRNNRGTNKKYADYTLMTNTRKRARGGPKWAIIKDGFTFFSAEDLSNAKPVSKEDRDEWALGVALVHYSMNAGLKKFKEKGEAGVSKELIQMHDMEVFRPVEEGSLLKKEKAKAVASLMFLKEKRDHSAKARMCDDG